MACWVQVPANYNKQTLPTSYMKRFCFHLGMSVTETKVCVNAAIIAMPAEGSWQVSKPMLPVP